jgi:hypothetical protein
LATQGIPLERRRRGIGKSATRKPSKERYEAAKQGGMAPVSNIEMPDCVTSLTDDQLRAALLARGLNPGPIVTSTRHLYRKKLAQFMLREEQVEGFDEQVDGFDKKEETEEEGKGEEEEDDFQPSATVVPSPRPGLRSRTVRRAEAEKEEEVARLDNQQAPVSTFSKLCELLMFAFKFLVFLIILGAGFLMYTTAVSSKSEEVGDLPLPSAPEKNLV